MFNYFRSVGQSISKEFKDFKISKTFRDCKISKIFRDCRGFKVCKVSRDCEWLGSRMDLQPSNSVRHKVRLWPIRWFSLLRILYYKFNFYIFLSQRSTNATAHHKSELLLASSDWSSTAQVAGEWTNYHHKYWNVEYASTNQNFGTVPISWWSWVKSAACQLQWSHLSANWRQIGHHER